MHFQDEDNFKPDSHGFSSLGINIGFLIFRLATWDEQQTLQQWRGMHYTIMHSSTGCDNNSWFESQFCTWGPLREKVASLELLKCLNCILIFCITAFTYLAELYLAKPCNTTLGRACKAFAKSTLCMMLPILDRAWQSQWVTMSLHHKAHQLFVCIASCSQNMLILHVLVWSCILWFSWKDLIEINFNVWSIVMNAFTASSNECMPLPVQLS